MRSTEPIAASVSPARGNDRPLTQDDLEDLPVVVLIREVARIYRRGVETIRKELRKGIFRPLPFDERPYRWRRVDIIDDVLHRSAESARRTRRRKAS